MIEELFFPTESGDEEPNTNRGGCKDLTCEQVGESNFNELTDYVSGLLEESSFLEEFGAVHCEEMQKHNGNRKRYDTTLDNGFTVKGIPALYEIVAKKQLQRLRRLSKMGEKFEELKRKKKFYCENTLAKTLLANGLAHCPNLSSEAAELLIPCVLSSFLVQLGLEDEVLNVLQLTPKSSCLKEIIRDEAFLCCMDVRREISQTKYVHIATDKGNNKGISHFVIFLIWWDKQYNIGPAHPTVKGSKN